MGRSESPVSERGGKMIFRDLVREIPWWEIAPRLMALYPGQIKGLAGYRKVYETLEAKLPRRSDMIVDLEWIRGGPDNDGYWTVQGRKKGTDDIYSLGLSPYSRWLGLTIGSIPYAKPSYKDKVDFLAHALWEMTFYGFSERETQNVKKKIMGRMKSLDKKIKAGKI
jgi:hypothetical protein